jgi:hypothetical protein
MPSASPPLPLTKNAYDPKFRPNPGLKLMDQVRERCSAIIATPTAPSRPMATGSFYLHDCGGKTPPNRLGTQEVERFLAHLATEGQVSAST